MSIQKLLVVGGNGFLGSAICKAAVGRGWEVSSMSSSGKPYATPAGHAPKWVDAVQWHAANAFEPSSYSSLVDSSTAVVHTLGILLEDAGYKKAVRDGNVFGVLGAIAKGVTGGQSSNPLKTGTERRLGYEGMNRDSALHVLDTMMASSSKNKSRPFVYISAADAFRPIVPERYVETKREAEREIFRRCQEDPARGIRPVFIRPGLMYHPHVRPISTLPAFLLSVSASLPLPNIFASRSLLGSSVTSLKTHPIHVDHVAEAILRSIDDPERVGVVDVELMRSWAGFQDAEEAVRRRSGLESIH
ncbi:putative mitochondrion protein [Kockovaella imperatae]|uniref:Putative mitochondrion protein n=1 Tax=Kockovaella imperatae TaxID=4999 RepID=A0A1Y1U7R4_9TREE|nr:putative mitochondrion protein [Kockovaella imperatae]ORX33547.1 putative mitochondrion protein [Kockovaella imperatae]